MATATKKNEKARFEAEGFGLRLVFEPQKEVFTEGGRKNIVAGTGKTIEFVADGYGAQFYESTDPEEIAELRKRAESGVFFEVPLPTPDSSPVLSQIAKAAARRDVDALVELAQAEEDTYQREDVMETIAETLDALRS